MLYTSTPYSRCRPGLGYTCQEQLMARSPNLTPWTRLAGPGPDPESLQAAAARVVSEAPVPFQKASFVCTPYRAALQPSTTPTAHSTESN